MTDLGAQLRERSFDDPAALIDTLAAEIASLLRVAVEARGQALIAVSGGSSPIRLFERLSMMDLPWPAITVTQVDERWLPPEHADSNARLIREHLLRDAAAKARFLAFKNAAETPEQGQPCCEAMLRGLGLPFDMVLLGMGEDGHTASLFPQAAELPAALDADGALCAAVRPPRAPYPRMSLSLAGLLSTRRLLLPLSGERKLKVFKEARRAGPVEAMPIRAVLRQNRVPLDVWTSV